MVERALVVGGDGLIGAAVAARLRHEGMEVIATTRRPGSSEGMLFLDLERLPETLPEVEVAFLCAGMKGLRECEVNGRSHRINVDGVFDLGKRLLRSGAFVVFISSDAVESGGGAYGRQKALVETALRSLGEPAVIRCGPITANNVGALACDLAMIGRGRRSGIHPWPPRA